MKQPKAYRMLRARVLSGELVASRGDVVYPCAFSDFGAAFTDECLSGKPHRSMTLDPSGDYPFFTVPVEDMEPIQ